MRGWKVEVEFEVEVQIQVQIEVQDQASAMLERADEEEKPVRHKVVDFVYAFEYALNMLRHLLAIDFNSKVQQKRHKCRI